MSTLLTPREIQRWYPEKWCQVAGNSDLINAWWGMIENGPCNTLFTGPHRTGKTRVISLGIKSLLCPNRKSNFDPCGVCPSCRAVSEARNSHTGLFSLMTESGYSFVPVDCQNVTPEEIHGITRMAALEDLRTVIYLDEVAALGRRGIEMSLLKPIDESPCIWFASAITVTKLARKRQTAKIDGLSDAMQARFAVKVGTTLPTAQELTEWIQCRCNEWQIAIEEPDAVLPLLIRRSGHRVGYVVLALSVAATHGRRLTPDLVKKMNFASPD